MTTARSASMSQLLAGYLAALVTMVSNVISASCVQALQGAIPDCQLSMIRSTVQGLTFIIAGLIVSSDFRVKQEHVPRLMYSSGSYVLFNIGFFAGSTYLPLSDLQGIVVITGISFAVAQSKLLFKRDIPKSVMIAPLICAVGIVLSVQPCWLLKRCLTNADTQIIILQNASSTLHNMENSSSDRDSNDSNDILLGYLFGIIGGAGQGIMIDANGVLLHDLKIIPKATYAMLGCSVISLALMFYFEDPVYMIDLSQFTYILGHSLLSTVAVFLAVYSASVINGPVLCVVWSSEVVIMLLSQYTIMHSVRPGNYNWIDVVGCLIVVFGASIPGVIDILGHKAKANELP